MKNYEKIVLALEKDYDDAMEIEQDDQDDYEDKINNPLE